MINGLLNAVPAVTITLVEQRTRDEVKLKEEIAVLEAEFRAIMQTIGDEEPWPYSRFTDAVKEGLKCMPLGDTLVATHRGAEQKVKMAKDILEKLRNFPERQKCAARQKIWIPLLSIKNHDHALDYYERFVGGYHGMNSVGEAEGIKSPLFWDKRGDVYITECVDWITVGQNYSAADLELAAKRFCEIP